MRSLNLKYIALLTSLLFTSLLMISCGPRSSSKGQQPTPTTDGDKNADARPAQPDFSSNRQVKELQEGDCQNNFNCPEDMDVDYELHGVALNKEGFYYESNAKVDWGIVISSNNTELNREWGIGIDQEKNDKNFSLDHHKGQKSHGIIRYQTKNGKETGYINFIIRDITRCKALSADVDKQSCENMALANIWDIKFSVPFITDENLLIEPPEMEGRVCSSAGSYSGNADKVVGGIIGGIFNNGQRC